MSGDDEREDDEREDDERRADALSEQATPALPIVVNTRQLMRGRKEVQIRHGSKLYRLRITSSGKLILNK